jgi:hypothetical protein
MRCSPDFLKPTIRVVLTTTSVVRLPGPHQDIHRVCPEAV